MPRKIQAKPQSSQEPDYKELLQNIAQSIEKTKIRLANCATRELMQLYCEIGKEIVERQKKFGWGKSIVERLAQDLTKLFPNSRGFSTRNLWEMKRFYEEYKDHSDIQKLTIEVPWGQNLLIMTKIKELSAREYYLQATLECGWTRNVLLNQINSQAYERQKIENKVHNFEKALPVHLAEQANETMKDIYMLDALGITKPVLERELEARIVARIKDVLLELGYGFCFIGNQYKIELNGNEYFIDLLFFHRKLKCLVAIELKVGKFLPEYAGKMNFYLNLLSDFVCEDWENPPIGLILCASRDKVEAEYALKGIDKPIGVAGYILTKELPKELSNKLPNIRQLEMQILQELDAPKTAKRKSRSKTIKSKKSAKV